MHFGLASCNCCHLLYSSDVTSAYEDYVSLLSDSESDIELQEVLEASLR